METDTERGRQTGRQTQREKREGIYKGKSVWIK